MDEWLLALYVSECLNLLSVETVGRGSISSVAIPTGSIIYRGRAMGAAGFFLAHNHPSGDPQPSKADIAVTCRLADVAREMDLPLLEHVVVVKGDIRTVGYW